MWFQFIAGIAEKKTSNPKGMNQRMKAAELSVERSKMMAALAVHKLHLTWIQETGQRWAYKGCCCGSVWLLLRSSEHILEGTWKSLLLRSQCCTQLLCEKAAILRVTEKFPRCVRKYTARLEQIQYLVAHVHCRRWSPRMLSASDFNVHPCAPLAAVGMRSRPAAMGRRGQDMCGRVMGMAVEWRLWATYESKVAFRSW